MAKLLMGQRALWYKVHMREQDPFEDAPLEPEAMLELLTAQRRSVETQMGAFVPYILGAWGIAWLFGFGALWLIDGLRPSFSLPLPVAVPIFVVLLAAAIAVSAVLGIRSGRGLRGNSAESFAGTIYGWAWTIGAIGIVGIGQGLAANGMDREVANLFYPTAFVFFAGIMYVLGAALWRAVPMLVLGIWIVLVAAAGPFFGAPAHYLVFSLAGGLAFLALGIAQFVRVRHARRSVVGTGARRG